MQQFNGFEEIVAKTDSTETNVTDNNLYAILTYFNFGKSKRRTQLFLEFLDRYKNQKSLRIVVVEATVDEFLLPTRIEQEIFLHLKFKYDWPYWCKENLINIAVAMLTVYKAKHWQYVSWIDPEITFLNENWVQDTLEALRISHVVQLFETENRLGPHGELLEAKSSFGHIHSLNKYVYPAYYEDSSIGIALGINRWLLEKAKGLCEYTIIGDGDHIFMLSLINKADYFLKRISNIKISLNFNEAILTKQKIYAKYDTKLGYVKGTILSHWHGRREDRNYMERWYLLDEYNPKVDLYQNSEFILNISDYGKINKTNIALYFKERNEDNMKV